MDELVEVVASLRSRLKETEARERRQVRVEASLRTSEGRYQALEALMPHAMVAAADGKITFVNAGGIDLLGASGPEEIIGRPALQFIHPEDHALVPERLGLGRRDVPDQPECVVRIIGAAPREISPAF
jgi:PAS domain-containing protein